MSTWKRTLDVSDIWRNDELTDEEKRPLIAKRVRGLADRLTDLHLLGLAADLEDAEDMDEFNAAWSAVYDWADWNRVWVDTWGFARKGADR